MYHRLMHIQWRAMVEWTHAVLLAGLPWVAAWLPWLAPLVAGGVVLLHRSSLRRRLTEPWASALVVVSSAAAVTALGGWRVAAGWCGLAAVVAVTAGSLPREGGGRPDAADLLAALGWGAAYLALPQLLDDGGGGWLAPAVLLLAARQLGTLVLAARRSPRLTIGPPTREVRGTLSLRGVVATSAGLPATVPLDLDIRAGESLAIVCDDGATAQSLADVLAGRTRPHAGEIAVDGAPPGIDDRLVAVVAPGEPFHEGGLEHNLGVLREEPPDATALGAAHDSCGLAEVTDAIGGRPLAADGDPLSAFHRLLVQAARVLVSHYRILVVVDPGPWVDARRSEVWRAAVVRASVGRTAVWITDDAELADRADHVLEVVDGALRTA
jgi:predicted ABC-type transport system involved in lysophospholipase L1 biosynthesis ATPase subunit